MKLPDEQKKAKLLQRQKLKQRQSLPLADKIKMTQQRIRDYLDYVDTLDVVNTKERDEVFVKLGIEDLGVYEAYSGGYDSTVLRDIMRRMGLRVPCVFSNTGLEMPEIVDFARAKDDVIEIRPTRHYHDIWREEGLPIGSKQNAKMMRVLQGPKTERNKNMWHLYDTGYSKDGTYGTKYKLPKKYRVFLGSDVKVSDKCCDYLKKKPLDNFAKRTGLLRIDAIMASEGGVRKNITRCNNYGDSPACHPMLFWTQEDTREYTALYGLEQCSVYYDREVEHNGEIVNIPAENRTGCMFCAFGVTMEKGLNRFQKMHVTHPRLHAIVTDRIGMRKAMEMINVKVDYE